MAGSHLYCGQYLVCSFSFRYVLDVRSPDNILSHVDLCDHIIKCATLLSTECCMLRGKSEAPFHAM